MYAYRSVNASFLASTMKCQYYKGDDSGTTLKIPICIWGDGSTVGIVADADTAAVVTGSVTSLQDAATLTAQVRNDTRVKLS